MPLWYVWMPARWVQAVAPGLEVILNLPTVLASIKHGPFVSREFVLECTMME
jgi:hypothetical protein